MRKMKATSLIHAHIVRNRARVPRNLNAVLWYLNTLFYFVKFHFCPWYFDFDLQLLISSWFVQPNMLKCNYKNILRTFLYCVSPQKTFHQFEANTLMILHNKMIWQFQWNQVVPNVERKDIRWRITWSI